MDAGVILIPHQIPNPHLFDSAAIILTGLVVAAASRTEHLLGKWTDEIKSRLPGSTSKTN
jgi:hypothetical protein